jgi:hypothetical protein
MNIDFSQFHPLDHTLAECVGYPGGRRRHLAYRWEFQWRDQLVVWFKHVLGLHTWFGMARLNDGIPQYFVRCRGCSATPDMATVARVIGNMRNDKGFQQLVQTLPTMADAFTDEEEDVE